MHPQPHHVYTALSGWQAPLLAAANLLSTKILSHQGTWFCCYRLPKTDSPGTSTLPSGTSLIENACYTVGHFQWRQTMLTQDNLPPA